MPARAEVTDRTQGLSQQRSSKTSGSFHLKPPFLSLDPVETISKGGRKGRQSKRIDISPHLTAGLQTTVKPLLERRRGFKLDTKLKF